MVMKEAILLIQSVVFCYFLLSEPYTTLKLTPNQTFKHKFRIISPFLIDVIIQDPIYEAYYSLDTSCHW